MKKLAMYILTLLCLLPLVRAAAQDGSDLSTGANCGNSPCTTTYHNNNARTGVNTHETVLVANSTGWTRTFGTTSTVPTDGMIYAQPLYVSGVVWTGGTGTNCPSSTTGKNMVYVATEGNTIYAIDADNYGLCAWVSLNTGNSGGNTDAAMPVTALPGGPCDNLTHSSVYGTVGVTGTPAIDPTNNMLFVVSAHKLTIGGVTSYTQRLNAVNITNLSLITSQVDIPSAVNGSGHPSFQTQNESQRAGLLLTKARK